jgi:MFS transporter, PAT family, beta-lactamase induction signal transducer AmpG
MLRLSSKPGLLRRCAARKDGALLGQKSIMTYRQYQHLTVVFLLGFSSGLPFALLGTTLQAWFADTGISVMQIGLLSLLGLPYTYRMIFAPMVDRYKLFDIGRRRSWMLLMQACLLIGFNLLAWLQPQQSLWSMVFLALVLSVCSAIQDTVIDAQRIEYLPESDYGLGAALAVLGYRIAILTGSGLALIFAAHHGWAWTYRLMGGLMVVGLLAAWFSEEPAVEPEARLGWAGWIEPFQALFRLPHWGWLFLFILLYKLGEAFTTTTSGIVMPFLRQELDFSLETIGYVNKLMGVSALLIGGLMAGYVLRTWSLYRALICFGVVQAGANLLFLALAMYGKVMGLFVLAVLADNLAAGMGSTALVVLLMNVVEKRFTATQFSVLVAISSLPRILAGPLGASIQAHVGWVGLYQWAVVMSLLFLPVMGKIKAFCSPRV